MSHFKLLEKMQRKTFSIFIDANYNSNCLANGENYHRIILKHLWFA